MKRVTNDAPQSSRAEFCESRQHRLEVERRPADDLEHVGGRRLLLKQFLEVARLRLHLVEQARVFYGDDGLVGEGLQDFDLALGEGAGLETREDDGPFDPVLPEEGHPNQAARGIATGVYRNRIF